MSILPEINYYTFSLLLGGVVALVSGVSVYLKGGKGKQNFAWLVLNISTAVWSFGYFFMIVSTDDKIALLSNWVLHSGAILIPFFYLLFVAHITGAYQKFKKYLYISSVFSASFFLLNLTTLFVKGVSPKYPFNYAPDAGPLYIYFTLYFFTLVSLAIFILIIKIPITRGEEASRLRYILWASIAGFLGGGSVFFLTFNINIPPYPLITFSLYPLIIAYAILKHNLFNIKLILVELAILLLNLFLFLNVFTSTAKTDLMLNAFVSLFIFAFSIVLIRGIYKDIRDRERIGGLVKDMEVANERLRMMEGQKTEFVSIASHQLRTPLTVIKGYASMILEGTFGSINAGARDAMEKLYKSSDRIVALVEDLLTVSRIEQGRMLLNLNKIDLKEFIKNIVEEIKNDLDDAKLKLIFNTEEGKDIFVEIDEKKFRQVVRRIFDNSIKYTPAHGSVDVSIVADNITDKARLIVSDTGKGMTPEQVTAIFERFNLKTNTTEQPDAPVEDTTKDDAEIDVASEDVDKGTPGIGLYIAQEIIEAHKGTLHIESAGVDKGTTVVVELPRKSRSELKSD